VKESVCTCKLILMYMYICKHIARKYRRHPMADSFTHNKEFVPNNTMISPASFSLNVITGYMACSFRNDYYLSAANIHLHVCQEMTCNFGASVPACSSIHLLCIHMSCHTTHKHNNTHCLFSRNSPNMAGKSSYMKQVALITILSHVGCFVPAVHCPPPVLLPNLFGLP